MTTKPNTRKAPAKAAAPARPRKQTPGEQKREVTDIRKLVSRWHWLEADQTYRAKKAKTEKESERLIAIHNDEQSDIEGLLAHAVPKSFLDACCLLEFATIMVDEGGTPDGFEVAMLKNVREGLRLAWAVKWRPHATRRHGEDATHSQLCDTGFLSMGS